MHFDVSESGGYSDDDLYESIYEVIRPLSSESDFEEIQENPLNMALNQVKERGRDRNITTL